ncbi:MAG: hypothetical protein OIF58_07820, partial [Cohaesibacter sp.]|nr:hypothetical protein [Cohaesibacter sp.]
VLVEDQLWRRHVDQMHKKRESSVDRTADISVTVPEVVHDNVGVEPIAHPRTECTIQEPTEVQSIENSSNATAQATAPAQPQSQQPRYPSRERKAPQRLGFDT